MGLPAPVLDDYSRSSGNLPSLDPGASSVLTKFRDERNFDAPRAKRTEIAAMNTISIQNKDPSLAKTA
jgi:hypothetical protein